MEACVLLAVLGGLLFSVTYAFVWVIRRRVQQRVNAQAHPFSDVMLIISVSAIPQAVLATIPWIFVRPSEIPDYLEVPLIMGASSMLVLWVWALIKIYSAAVQLDSGGWRKVVFALPLVVSLVFFAGLVIGRFR